MTTANSPKVSEPSPVARFLFRSGLFWIGLAALGCLAFFWDGISSLFEAWSRPEYSHGPLIPLIAGYLFLREFRKEQPKDKSYFHIPALATVLLGAFVGLLGNLTQIPDLITYGLIVVVGGLILMSTANRQGSRYWVAWIYLFFMLPLPNIVYWQLSVKMQFISSKLGVDFIQLLGIPVFLDGNIIDLGIYRLQVAEACNGLRYLFPLMSFGFLVAALYRGPAWHKVILFLSSMPITIFMNSLRIGVIGILVNSFGIAQAEGFLHWFEGWIIFVACIMLLYLEALILQMLTSKPHSALNILDLDIGGGRAAVDAAASLHATKKLVWAASFLMLCGAIWQFMPTREAPVVARETLAVFPMEVAEWRGQREKKLDPVIETALAADEYLLADYSSQDQISPVNLFMTYYKKTTGGPGIHSPEVCIPGGGWEISRWQQISVPIGPVFTVNRAVIQKGEKKQIVYYWYELRGRRLTSEYSAKFYAIWDSFTISRTDGGLVRVVTPLEKGEPEINGDKRIAAFLKSVTPLISAYIPE
jgi:exosortase D (VPLPA-CTERM-specific)